MFVQTLSFGQTLNHSADQCRLNTEALSLRGENAFTSITNHTSDTLKLEGTVFYYLPVAEKSVKTIIAPGNTASMKIKMNYPDFIQFTSLPLRIYNAPGKTVKCTIENIGPVQLTFAGDLSDENRYYQAYFRIAQSNQAYYKAGSQVNDFNTFPALADSINNINLNFLKTYQGPLSPSFRKNEYWRLMYNNAFLKHHVLFDKTFRSGRHISVDSAYYRFDRDIPLINKDMILSSEYLWYTMFRLRSEALKQHRPDSLLSIAMLKSAQEIYGENELGDVLKMRLLYDVYRDSKRSYERLLHQTRFINPENERILDSVSYTKFSLPFIGKIAPDFELTSFNGDSVTLSQFKRHKVILNFWAAWCAPCIKEFPFENKLHNIYANDKKLIVINICLDSPFDTWKSLSVRHQLTMVNLFADEDSSKILKKKYNISTLPKSVLIDENMNVVHNNFKRASQVKAEDLE